MPRSLLPPALVVTVLLALALIGSGGGSASADPALDSEEQAFVTLLNDYRAQNGLAPLTVIISIGSASDWMSADMGQKAYFSHTDSLGRSPWTRMCDFGYCYNTWKGENLAAGYTTAQSVFNGWKASPGHNANMLNANYKVMGLARVYTVGSPFGWYWTNDFGGYIPPESAPVAPTSTPAPTTTPAPTPSPTPSPAPGCAGDADCDAWPDAAEIFVGTSPSLFCNSTAALNDESPDAWPPDLNDDGLVNIFDAMTFKSMIGASNPRWDLNRDGVVTILDSSKLAPFFGLRCQP